MTKKEEIIAVIGLGYVGLPLALEFSKHFETKGYDVNDDVIQSSEGCVQAASLSNLDDRPSRTNLILTSDPEILASATVYIVTVPTPVDNAKVPDTSSLESATHMISKHLKPGDLVVFESTVYPGATEEICVPILMKGSSLQQRIDFNVGFSPERINPGDKDHCLNNIVKVVSGDTKDSLKRISGLYSKIVSAGVYEAQSIRVAEAAKVIENVQRDINIALVNELAMVCHLLGIDTNEVLAAAGTKWNFLPFKPGLVGGHCIGVDPYYLTHKAVELGYHPEVILAGRRLNEGMAGFVARAAIKEMSRAGVLELGSKVLILGATFKANVSDVRNSKILSLWQELTDFGCDVEVLDPLAQQPLRDGVLIVPVIKTEAIKDQFDAVIFAVNHDKFSHIDPPKIFSLLSERGVIIDLTCRFSAEDFVGSEHRFWRL